MVSIVPVEFCGDPCATSCTAHCCRVAAWYVCIPLFELIQRTAIVSSGHPWLQQSILCQPLGMLAAQRLVDYQRRAGFPALEHIHVPVMCQMPHPWIIILPSTDPRVAMATVSVIVSVVLAGCSHGNNVCNRGLVQIKLFRCEMHVWEEPQRMGHTRTHTPTAQTRAFTETEHTPSREHMHSHSHGGVDIDRQSAGVIFLPPFPNKRVSTATILIVMWRRRQRKDWQREREARRWKGSPRREYGSGWREEGGVVIYK